MSSSKSWVTIDCQYLFPRFAASYLKVKNGRSLFIENNTARAIPQLLAALEAAGSDPKKVDFLIVTHAHLDHAGASGHLVEIFPNAMVLAHPKAARVLQDPSKLVSGAKRVYGEERFVDLYGEIKPVPSSRIQSVRDKEILDWQGEKLEMFHTLGHASHHFCVRDLRENSIFSGDAFGVSYPDLAGREFFHIPSTSPVDFQAEEAIKVIEQIESMNPEVIYLTHFGAVREIKKRAERLKELLRLHLVVLEDCKELRTKNQAELLPLAQERLKNLYQNELNRCGIQQKLESCSLLKLDWELNAAGIVYASQNQ